MIVQQILSSQQKKVKTVKLTPAEPNENKEVNKQLILQQSEIVDQKGEAKNLFSQSKPSRSK